MRVWRMLVRVAIVAVVARCSSQTGATTPNQAAPVCDPRADTGTLGGARAAAVAYVNNIAMHQYDAAGKAIEPCNRRDDRAVHRLWDFMAGLRANQAKVQARA